ncbi:MAG: hypothetical protein QOE70_6182 [Chthoniobacter sp.]|jgi:hypothetical protein|nr:hypothetical protein [Chthoniobacter sp.]
MRRNYIIALVVFAVMNLVALWLLWPKRFTQQPTSAEKVSAGSASPPVDTIARNHAAVTAEQFDEGKLNPQQREYLAEFKRPINFYGMVVDEARTPVEGATVTLGPIDNPIMSDSPGDARAQSSTSSAKSDAQGRFAVTGMRGSHLLVRVSKNGYYSAPNRSDAFFSHDTADPVMNWRLLPRGPEEPAIFVLRKKGEGTPLIRLPHLSVIVGKDGRPVDIHLATGRAVPVGQGDIRIEMSVGSEVVGPDRQYDWRCRISVPGGGLLPRKDDFEFIAPEEGYQPEEIIEKPKSLPRDDWDTDVFRHYFVKTGSGNYARVRLRLITRNSGSCVIEEAYLNPAGSPNLEYDPSKQASAR